MKTGSFMPDGGLYDNAVPRNSLICEFENYYGTLPHRVVKWAGLKTDDGVFDTEVPFNESTTDSLAYLNDNGAKFSEIANVIEDRVAEL